MFNRLKAMLKRLDNADEFITVWKVAAGDEIKFALRQRSTTEDFTVNWGDGCVEQVFGDRDCRHVYADTGEYTVSISNQITEFSLATGTPEKLIEIKQWGIAQWKTMEKMFYGAGSMICTAVDRPDLSRVVNIDGLFYGCEKLDARIEDWGFERTADTEHMFGKEQSLADYQTKRDEKLMQCAAQDTEEIMRDLGMMR